MINRIIEFSAKNKFIVFLILEHEEHDLMRPLVVVP